MGGKKTGRREGGGDGKRGRKIEKGKGKRSRGTGKKERGKWTGIERGDMEKEQE